MRISSTFTPFGSPSPGYGDKHMHTPKYSSPATSNKVMTGVDVANIDSVAYPVNKNGTIVALLKRRIGHAPILRGLVALLVCGSATVAQAQLVFIPDVQMRGWLNGLVMDVVDADGYMNTADPYLDSITDCSLWADWDPVDLTGLEYLTGLESLTITFEAPEFTSVTFNALPPALSHLTIQQYQGSTLPPLPGTLRSLDLYAANNITSLSGWPSGLEHIGVDYAASLTSIAPLPSSMNVVGLRGLPLLTDLTGILPDTINSTLNLEALPQLTDLPPFPYFVDADTLLIVNLEQLHAIPSLPDHIGLLNLWMLPMVTTLPSFPADLKELELIGLDGLGALPQFPSATFFIHFSGLPLVNALPTLPDSLSLLYIGYMPLLECLPPVPPNTSVVSVFNSGVDCVPNMPVGLNTNLPLCGFYNTGGCPFFSPSVTGTVYHDLNANGVRDTGEPGVGYATVDVTPGNTITGVADDGFYAQALNAGTYNITANVNNAYVTSISPASHSAVLVNMNDVDSLNDFGVVLQANVQDLLMDLTQVTPARPGFSNALQLTFRNQGTMDMSGTVTFNFDDDQEWNGSTPPPDMLTGNAATWNFADLVISEQRQIDISLYTDAAVPIGTPIAHAATADPVTTDETPADNADNITAQVVGSSDPNDKTVSPAEMASAELASGERLTYTIRFQNTGTYQADRVIITDTLSTALQWNTMDLIASSHPCTWFIQDGTLRFTFDPIALPDSTSDEPGSHGFVAFSMAPQAMLTDGMQVGNTANIYFDLNAPVITNEALFSVSDPQGIPSAAGMGPMLSPNPVHDVLRIGPLTGSRSTLTVLDATGRMVMNTVATGQTELLDVSALPPGAYQLRLHEQGGVRHFVKY